MNKISLPIDEVLPQVVSQLSAAGALVLIAAPGAGKTTRVAPAILDAALAELAGAEIIVLQPRRVAARAAAARISDERGTKLGEEVGYIVRHERRVSARTRIVVCTEGVFLRRLQEDPTLENVAAVIFDEFHERSLDSDLALALVRQVRSELRPDLKLIVMSATLDGEPVSAYLNNCPVVNSPGRTYPVAIEYLQFQPQAKTNLEQTVVNGIKKMLATSSGHILAFLPGVGEIRKTQELLETTADQEGLLLLPLYGDLPLEEQQRVLQDFAKQRKVVLATNVAETSLTIDGVTAVVDSGLARVNRLDPRLGLNQLGLERISRASADQRAGRAGRTTSGACLRLWTEREHQSLEAFTSPEIERVDLSECILQLLAWGEKDLQSFNWYAAPPAASLSRALELLDHIDATENGTLTKLGRSMALLPLQPRLARLLIEGARYGNVKDTAICAALLSERDPIRRTNDKSGAQHKSESDVLDRVWALNEFAERGHKHSVIGELMVNQARQILRTADQLSRLVSEETAEKENATSSNEAPDNASLGASSSTESVADLIVRRALMAAFSDRICRRREPGSKSALMVGGRGVKLTDDSAVVDSEFFVAVEMIETGKSDASVRQASAIEKSWLPKSHLTSGIEVIFEAGRQKVVALKRTRFFDLLIEESVTSIPNDIDPGEILAAALNQSNTDLLALVDDDTKQFLARLSCLREHMPELNLPEFSSEPWRDLLPQWCMGLSSLAELKQHSLLPILQAQLTHEQLSTVEREAPERILVPSGNRIKLEYEAGKPPVLAVRIQELFGMTDTPRVARSRQPVLMHLLAPNYRVQQITPDLASFWKNTYNEVKKDLKARYPKHSWPENPLMAQAESRPKRRPQ